MPFVPAVDAATSLGSSLARRALRVTRARESLYCSPLSVVTIGRSPVGLAGLVRVRPASVVAIVVYLLSSRTAARVSARRCSSS
jgi:hypothetical protein